MSSKLLKSKFIRILAFVASLPFFLSGNDAPSQLEQIERRGSMTMVTRNGASSYYLGADGPTGPEFDLASRFAEFLGVSLEVEVANAFVNLEALLISGPGDMIAANLTRNSQRERLFNFGPDYFETTTEVLYRRGSAKPTSIADLVGKKIMIIKGSSYEQLLEDARHQYPLLHWEARGDVGMEDLLQALSDGAIDITISDSNIFSLNRQFYPRTASAFNFGEPKFHAWAFRPGSDDSLPEQARLFMAQAKADGVLEEAQQRFYTPKKNLDQVGMFQFLEHLRERLPPLLAYFRESGTAEELDWRLLAAMGYQESNWDVDAASYTGVRGIMMLTNRTAAQLGVDNRLDPEQSISGGARYFRELRSRIPSRIAEPDRTWMALAAYNMGMGHLEDARILTQTQNMDPDSWADVRESLDLLSQEQWHQRTQYGYARGFEARQYVHNISKYLEVLVWMDTRAHPLLVSGSQ